ncbi:unnamed protein product [Polarella glacialis]|uniref:Late embryogenesis abundant protein LEA-2 subgroup domain-containing protein n=1 Tax=Polarella glacialis TaxID=89957 RepID=A0A813IAK1_POLGL|nr:unnamed protein product [Polarella glacialis]
MHSLVFAPAATMQIQNSEPEKEAEWRTTNDVFIEYSAEREVNDVDVSAEAVSQSSDSMVTQEDGKSNNSLWRFRFQSRRGKRLCMGMSACGLVVLAALVTGVALLWPRQPSWELQALEFDKDALSSLMDSFAGNGGGNSTIVFNLTTTVAIYNPNFVGVVAEPGRFLVLFNGKPMAVGLSDEVTVPAHNSFTMPVHVNIELSSAFAEEIGKDVTANSFEMHVTTQGYTQVLLPWLGMKVHCEVDCSIQAGVLKLLSDPVQIIESKSCDYSYSF